MSDLDTGMLSLIDGYVSDALNATGTKRAVAAPSRVEQHFEGDTIPDVMPIYCPEPPAPLSRGRAARGSQSVWYEDFDELTTAVIVKDQQRLIR